LFYGPFSKDANLYRQETLEGFNSWLGVGQLLVAPQLHEGGATQNVYFPKASREDKSLYFNLHAPFERYTAGETKAVPTPIEHGALFAREGAVIPIGKPKATVTALSGDPRTHTDGVDVILESEGGQVGLDDWRGVLLFPGREGRSYTDAWIEDDGISVNPGTSRVRVTYTGREDIVDVDVKVEEKGFTPLWKGELQVVLPMGDLRAVSGANRSTWNGRDAWTLKIE
jgi:alpha-glucosidase (family GH31 glycosyl hydrolase)